MHDRITVAGLPPSIAQFPVRVRYLGPVPPPADGDCALLPAEAFAAAGVLGEATVTVTGNGEYATPDFAAPPGRGCTTFDVASLAPLWPGGPILSAAPNAADESIEVVSVVLSTTISPVVVEPGGAVDVFGMSRCGGDAAVQTLPELGNHPRPRLRHQRQEQIEQFGRLRCQRGRTAPGATRIDFDRNLVDDETCGAARGPISMTGLQDAGPAPIW